MIVKDCCFGSDTTAWHTASHGVWGRRGRTATPVSKSQLPVGYLRTCCVAQEEGDAAVPDKQVSYHSGIVVVVGGWRAGVFAHPGKNGKRCSNGSNVDVEARGVCSCA